MRLDRLVSLGLYTLSHTKKYTHSILMYHSVDQIMNSSLHPYFETTVTPSTFKNHCRFLKDNQLTPRLLSQHCQGASDDSCHVVLTFDDGYMDFYTHAFPIIQEYSLCADVFLPTSFINTDKPGLEGKRHLRWEHIKEMSKKGVSFGSHSHTHPKLVTLNEKDLKYELEYSKKTIEDTIGIEVDTFAYPYAFPEQNSSFVDTLSRHLSELGYRYGVTTKIGSYSEKDHRLFFKRIPVNEYDDLKIFKAKLMGYYNWLYPVQKIAKKVKSLIK